MKNSLAWLALVCIPLYGFWTFPQWNQLKIKQTEITKLQEQSEEKSIQIKEYKTALSTLEGDIGETLLKQIPFSLKQELIMIDLQRIIQESEFIFDGLTFAKGQDKTTNAAELRINFSAQGRKENLPKLLKNIEQNQRFMGLENLNFSETEINGIKLVSVTANVYNLAQSDQ